MDSFSQGRGVSEAFVWTAFNGASITPALFLKAASRAAFGAQVAQLVEHVTENHGVGGSIPSLGTNLRSRLPTHA